MSIFNVYQYCFFFLPTLWWRAPRVIMPVYTLHMMCPILLKCSEPRRNHSPAWKLGLLAIIWLCVWCISPVVTKIHNIFLSLMFILDSFNKEYWGETYAIFDTIIVLYLFCRLCIASLILFSRKINLCPKIYCWIWLL